MKTFILIITIVYVLLISVFVVVTMKLGPTNRMLCFSVLHNYEPKARPAKALFRSHMTAMGYELLSNGTLSQK